MTQNFNRYFHHQGDDVVPSPTEVPEDALCQEASSISVKRYVPCCSPATALVFHRKDNRSYWMCPPCADHNIRNRGGILVAGSFQYESQKVGGS